MADTDMFGIQIDIKISKSNINEALKTLQKYIDGKKLNVGLSLSTDAIKGLEKLAKQVDDTQKKINKNNSKNGIQIFDKAQLEKDGKEFIQYYTKDIDKLKSHLQNKFKDIQNVSNIQLFKNSKGDVTSFSTEIQKTTGEIEKLKYSLAYIQNQNKKNRGFILDTKSITQGEIPTPTLTKKTVDNANYSKTYELFSQRLKQIELDLIKNGATIGNILEIADTKTGAITKATVQYTDSLGKAKTQAYELKKVYEDIKNDQGNVTGKQLKSLDLVPTTTTYKNDIGIQQKGNYAEIKKELGEIQKLNIEKLKTDQKDIQYINLLDKQIKEHQTTINKILNTYINISETEKTLAINAQQVLGIEKLRKKQLEEIDRINIKPKTVSTTTSGKGKLGEEVPLHMPINYNASEKELNAYAKAIGGLGAEYTKVIPKIDNMGNKFKEMHIRIKEGGDKWHNYIANIDEASGKIYKIDRGISDVSNRQLGVFEKFKVAMSVYPVWMAATTIFMQSIYQIRDAVTFINQLDKSMTNISMITGRTREEVSKMTQEYANLASQLHDTVSSVSQASEEFLRAGHNQEATLKLIESSTIMSKIAGQDQKSTADQLIAITNAYGLSAEKTMEVVDKLTTVDNASATSTKELGTALERTAASAQMAGVNFSTLVSYVATVSSVTRKSASSIGESFNDRGLVA